MHALVKLKSNLIVFVIIVLAGVGALFAENFTSYNDFRKAKSIANKLIDYPETIYSGCKLGKNNHIDIYSCGFKPKNNAVKESRLEYEHILPMAHAKQHFRCWRESICIANNGKSFKGRRCCQQIDSSFRQLEGELFNIFPELGAVNQARRDFKFTEFSVVEKTRLGRYRGLPIYIDFKYKRIEPRDEVKGLVARASLFTANRYHIRLSKSQSQLFQYWHKKYPPSKEELKWAAQVTAIQGYNNPLIK